MQRFSDIWHSFRRMPLWVQMWMAFILVPVNLVPLWFVGAPYGGLIAALSLAGMAPNVVIMWIEKGLSRAMALPHVVIWTPLVLLEGAILSTGVGLSNGYVFFMVVHLAVNIVSLGFDYIDAVKWLRGARDIA